MTGGRTLVTGAAGFVGAHVLAMLRKLRPDDHVVGTILPGQSLARGVENIELDIANAASVETAIRNVRPTGVVHLAAIAEPEKARAEPALAHEINVIAAKRLAEMTLKHAPAARFIFASSSEAYGASFRDRDRVDESAPLKPLTRYGEMKAEADIALGELAHAGLKAVRFRPFNHTGPGQAPAFAVAAFAQQIARIEKGEAPPVVSVGNLDAERDFVDVRDIARAYVTALDPSLNIPQGAVFNLASGKARSMRSILDALIVQARVPVDVQVDLARLRPVDLPRCCGDASKALNVLGWRPEIPFEQTLKDVLDSYRASSAD